MNNDSDSRESEKTDEEENLKVMFSAVISYCNELIKHPRIELFSNIRKIVNDQAKLLNFQPPSSYQNNLKRKVSNYFPQLRFIQKTKTASSCTPHHLM